MASSEVGPELQRTSWCEHEQTGLVDRLVSTARAELHGQARKAPRSALERATRGEAGQRAHPCAAAWFVQRISEALQEVETSKSVRPAPQLAEPTTTMQTLSLSAKPLPLAELERLLLQTTLRTGDRALGLTVGARAGLGMLIGELPDAPGLTVRELLDRLCRSCSAIDGVDLQLRERGARATVVFRTPSGYPEVARFCSELLFLTLVRVIHRLHPQLPLALQRICFAHAAPRLESRHAELLCGAVLFKQKFSSLRLARGMLDLGEDDGELALACEAAEPTSSRVRERLSSHPSLDKVDCYALAAELGLTWRALRRRLSADGTSLSALVDEARCAVACAALARGVPIKAVAEQAGYSDHSGLFRAFKRCTGMTPAAYRRQAWRELIER